MKMEALMIIMLCILCLLLFYLLVIIFSGLFICIGSCVYNLNLYFYPKNIEKKLYNLETIIVINPNGEVQLGIKSI